MKNLLYSLFAFGLFFCSCSKDADTEMLIEDTPNFIGCWEGNFLCSGPLSEETETVMICIDKIDEINYSVALADDLTAVVSIEDGKLIFDDITLNASQDYDVVWIDGYIEATGDDTIQFEFEHDVDDDGISECDFELIRM